ncbi:MAG: response regulator [Vicingus serpentipes]|nr:response regulator [Vicingus serpentipes]
MRYSVIACWVAVVLNPLWIIIDYFTVPEKGLMFLFIDLPVSVLILILVLMHERLKLSAEALGGTAFMLIALAASYTYNQLELEDFTQVTASYVALFIGAGMLLLWETKYSVIFVSIILLSNLFFFYMNSPLSVEEFMLNGGALTFTVAIFMIFSIHIKYSIIRRNVMINFLLSKKQEELIEEKQVAEKARELQSQFLSNMSHEIRTPMNGILGMARLLQKTKQTKEQEKYINAIYTSADNLMVIINDILDFSKIEAGKVVLEEISFNIRERFKVLHDILILKANEKGISLDFSIEENVPDWLIGDPVRLNQIILNLTSNAVKFTKKGVVKVNVKALAEKGEKIKLRCTVKDTGMGIPKDKLHNIFSSFTQASSATTREYGGTGLGLTISKQLVEIQGGKIFVESEEGKGSTFGFSIEYLIDTTNKNNIIQKPILKDKGASSSLNNLKVLLVEDHEINQMLAITVLEGWDFKVDLAVNGKEAVEKVADGQYDIVLMDIHMPIMDGYEATRNIREELNSNIPIIAMTASALIGDNQKCFDAGMNDYISKPFDTKLILEKIKFQISNVK